MAHLAIVLSILFYQTSIAQSPDEVDAIKKLYDQLGLFGTLYPDFNFSFSIPLCSQERYIICKTFGDDAEEHISAVYFSRVTSLAGAIPSEIGALTYLISLDLSRNNIFNTLIPSQIAKLSSLTTLDLSDNVLTGPLPKEMGNMSSLIHLDLGSNILDNIIPEELKNLILLTFLDLSSNRFTGNPPELNLMTSLEAAYLDHNRFSGQIPSGFFELSNLETLVLQANEFKGTISPNINKMCSIKELYFDDNELFGRIPSEMFELPHLETLYLSHNKLNGTIPPEILLAPSLTSVYMGYNKLSCPLIDLENVLYHDMDDLIDQMDCGSYGHWVTSSWLECDFNGERLVNSSFCSDDEGGHIYDENCASDERPINTNCTGDWILSDWGRCVGGVQERTAECRSIEDNIHMNDSTCLLAEPTLEQNCFLWLTREIKIVIAVVSVVIAALMGFTCYRYKKYKKLQQNKNIIPFKNFFEISQLAEGHFSIVYKVTWNSSQGDQDVVCKIPKLDPSKNDWLELVVLNNVTQHDNVLSLLGICTDFHFQDADSHYVEGICVVLPFYPRGSMDNYLKALHEPLSHDTRCTLAVGMVKGLQHLHDSGFLHRDVAARNFLLSSDNANIILSDFGLSRPISEDEEYKFIGQAKLPAINAPETLSKATSTRESDIWQLGVAFWWLHAAGRGKTLSPFSTVEPAADSFLSTLSDHRHADIPLEFYDSSEFVQIIKKCCSFDPEDRPTTQVLIVELTLLCGSDEYKVDVPDAGMPHHAPGIIKADERNVGLLGYGNTAPGSRTGYITIAPGAQASSATPLLHMSSA